MQSIMHGRSKTSLHMYMAEQFRISGIPLKLCIAALERICHTKDTTLTPNARPSVTHYLLSSIASVALPLQVQN